MGIIFKNGFVVGSLDAFVPPSTPTPTVTPTNTITPTKTVTPTITPTNSVTPTNTITPTKTVTPTPSKTPASISATLVFDLDGANYSAMPTNGSTIAGTGAYTITMTNTGNSMAWNGANGGVFRKSSTGTSDMFYVSGLNYSTSSQPWTVFMAYKWDGGTAGRLLNANTASPDFLMGLWGSPASRMNIAFNDAFVGSNTTAADTAWHFIWMTNDGLNTTNSTKSYIATTTAPSTTNGTRNGSSGFNGLRLFGRFSTSTTNSEPVTADVAFVKVYNGALTLAEIQSLHATYNSRFIDPTPTPTPTNSVTPTNTITPTNTVTPTPSVTTTITPTNSVTPTPSVTTTITPTNSVTPSITPTTVTSTLITDGLFMELNATDYISGNWNDRTVNGNNATINGATWLSDNGGIFDLDGVNDTIQIPHKSNFSLNTSTQRTIQVWVKFDTLPALNTQGQPVFGKLSSSFGFDGYWGGLFSNAGKTRIVTNGTGVQKITDSTTNPVSVNTWYLYTFISQITATVNTTKVYINTTEVSSTAHGSDGYGETNPLYLGYIGTGISSTFLDGKIGAAYFYTKGLSALDVTNNFNVTKSKYGL